ncbi:MAG: hypothetical protein O9340_04670 [Cyclobacteriaceae bacterium]|jgi:hypothetical protein|nr:hypothetical protein [Cyclobacteriaceae bacterium]
MNSDFELVDSGCLMLETKLGRWIIEHPKNGYLETTSKKWDIIIEHPDEPHRKPLKFMGSFKNKRQAINEVKQKINQGIGYFNAIPNENEFYNSDYSQK